MGASVRPQPPDPWLTRWIEQFTTAPSDATRVRPAPQGPTIGAAPRQSGPKFVNPALLAIPGVQEGIDAAHGDWDTAIKSLAFAAATEGAGKVVGTLAKLRAGQRAAANAEAALAGRVLNEGVDFGSGSLRGALGTPSEAETQALLDAMRPATAAKPLAEAEAAAEYFRRTRQPFPAIREGPGPSPAAVAEREARNARYGRR